MNENWIIALVESIGPEEAAEWLTDKLIDLGNRTPLEAVADGEQDAVAEYVAENF